MNRTRNVAIFLFDEVEALDFCGPLEVFSVAKVPEKPAPFHVFTCAEHTQTLWANGCLSINPQYPLHNCPAPDILVVPGGKGTRDLLENAAVLEWLRKTVPGCEVVLSVCTGALLLAKAGLLEGLSATTHQEAMDLLRFMAPRTTVRQFERFVDNGQIIVAAGISAGIDAALHVVGKLIGTDVALTTAKYLEYDSRRPE